MKHNGPLMKLLAVLLAFVMIATACGGDDDDGTNAGGTSGGDTDETTGGEDPDTEGETAGQVAEGDVDTEIVDEDPEGGAQYGGVVTLGLEAESPGLRPWEDALSSPAINMANAVFDKIVEARADGTIGPWLAESFTSNADFTEWTVTLREGVTFHNGVELTGQTLVDMFAIQLTGAQSSGQIGAAGMDLATCLGAPANEEEGTEAVPGDITACINADGQNVTYTLLQPNSAFMAYLERMPLGLVFEPGAAAADPDGFSSSPVGTGPFVVEKRDIDNETVMVRNESYWAVDAEGNQLPYLDGITFRPIPDEGTRLDSLLSGTVNAMQTLRQGTIRDGRDARDGGADITLYEFQGNNVGGGMFNVAVAPYDDVRVRRGLTQMNNQDAVIEALGGTGISLPGSQWFSPDSVWYSQKVADAWPQFDFEGGKATLQEYIDDPARSDGKAPGEKIDVELSCPPDPTLVSAMQVLEFAWNESGLVNVDLTSFDQATHINNALGAPPDWTGVHGAHCWRWSSDNDPSTELNRQFLPWNGEVAAAAGLDGVVGPQNFFNYFDADLFADLNAAIATDDFQTRYDLYEAVMMKVAEDVPLWYSGHTATMIATESNIVGLNSWNLPDGTLGIGFPNAEGRWHQVSINN